MSEANADDWDVFVGFRLRLYLTYDLSTAQRPSTFTNTFELRR